MGDTITHCLIEFAELNTMLFEHPEAINVKVNLIKDELHRSRYRANSNHIAQKMLEAGRTTKKTPLQLPLSA